MKNPIRFQINIALFVTLYAFFSYVVPPCSYGEYSSYRTFCPVTYSAAISPDGSRIAGGSDNPGFRVWDARTGELLGQFFHPHKDPISAVAFSGDSKYLATGDIGMDVSRILVWDLSTMEVVRTIEIPSSVPAIPLPPIRTVALSANGNYVAAGRDTVSLRDKYDPSVLKVWAVDDGREILHIDQVFYPTQVAFLPSGDRLLVKGKMNDVECGTIWNIFSGELLRTFETYGGSLLLSMNGRRISTSKRVSNMLNCFAWDVETGEKVHTFSYEGYNIEFGALSPDGSMTLMRVSNSTQLVDTDTGKVLREFGNMGVPYSPHQAFTADGRFMITVYANVVNMFDISDLAAGVKQAEEYEKRE